ncbi:MAG: hypothetical protein MJZ38_05215 [archaeon]|nr:hypothetical protein [archaeon]
MAESRYSRLCERVEDILGSPMKVEKTHEVPGNIGTSHNRAYDVTLGAVFVDMRDSAELFSGNNRELVAKIAKTFDGTMLRMLRAKNCVEMGVRGNTVFALYSVTDEQDARNLVSLVAEVNSAVRLLNILYAQRNLDTVPVGIGASISRGLVMKARCKLLGDRDRIWIADAIHEAIGLAKTASSKKENGRLKPVALSPSLYNLAARDTLPDDVTVVTAFSDDGGAFLGDIRSGALESWIENHFFG